MEGIVNTAAGSDITILKSLLWIISALAFGAVGGAVGGVIVGGKHMGNELAAIIGACYGPISAVPGVIIGLILLAIL